MEAVRSADSETWHLIGARGCGATPDGRTVDGPWAVIRDEVTRDDDGSRCSNCAWPQG